MGLDMPLTRHLEMFSLADRHDLVRSGPDGPEIEARTLLKRRDGIRLSTFQTTKANDMTANRHNREQSHTTTTSTFITSFNIFYTTPITTSSASQTYST